MENKKRKFQESVPLAASSNGTASKLSRDDEGGIGNELLRSEDETRVMAAFQSRSTYADANESACDGSHNRDPLESRSPERLLTQVLACSPPVFGVLCALPVKQWLLLRRVSSPWKKAVDYQLRRSLKVLHVGKEEEAVKIPLLLRFMSEKALALSEIRFNSRFREPLAGLILLELRSFKRLTVLDLINLCPMPPTDAGSSKVLDLLERQAEKLESLILPCYIWQKSLPTWPLLKSRLELVFSRLCVLRRLEFSCTNNKHLHSLVLAIPHPDKLQRLVVGLTSDTMLQFLQRCSELRRLEIVLGQGNVEERLLVATLSQLQSLNSLVIRRRPNGIRLSVQSLNAISGLKQLEEWSVESDALPELAAVSWGGQGFRSLTHLHLSSVEQQCHLDVLNQIPSLVSLELLATGFQLCLSLALPLLQSLFIQAVGGTKTLTFHLQKSFVLTKVHLSSRFHTSFACIISGLLQRSPRLQELRLDLPLTESKSVSMARYCPRLEVLDLDRSLPWFHSIDSQSQLQNPLLGTLEAFVACCPHLKMVKMSLEDIGAFNLVSRFPNISFLGKK